MKAPFAMVAAYVLAGCSIVAEPVALAIRTDPFTPACHTSFTTGTLISDDDAGTAIVEDGSSGTRTLPVLWPEGFTARRLFGVVEVYNQDGEQLARTGQKYKLLGGYDEAGWRGCDGVIPDPG
jgi:hypothetical protein